MTELNLQMFAEPALPENAAAAELNYETEAFLNVAADKTGAPEWASLAALTKNMTQSLNEALYQATYYKDQGWASTQVTGAQLIITLTGDCMPGDRACDYLLSEDVQFGLGEARKSHLKLKRGDKVIIWPVTLANITPAYGDANQPNALTVTIHGNGRPVSGSVTTA